MDGKFIDKSFFLSEKQLYEFQKLNKRDVAKSGEQEKNAVKAPSVEPDETTTQKAEIDEVVDKFLTAKIEPADLSVQLKSKGVQNVKISGDSDFVKVEFALNDKSYVLNSAKDSTANSTGVNPTVQQSSDFKKDTSAVQKTTGVTTSTGSSNRASAADSGQVRVYEEQGEDLLNAYHNTFFSTGATLDEFWGYAHIDPNHPDADAARLPFLMYNVGEQNPNDINPINRPRFLNEQAAFCMSYLGLEGDPREIDVVLARNPEAREYVRNHPEIFHYVFDEQNIPWPDATMSQYMLDSFKEANLYVSADTQYCSYIQNFKNSLDASATDGRFPFFRMNLEGNMVEITDETIEAFAEYLHNDTFSDYYLGNTRFYKWGPDSGFYQHWLNFVEVFGLSPTDDNAAIREKLETFFKQHGSADGKTLHVEDYYNSLSPLKPSYQDIQNYYNFYEGQQAEALAKEAAQYGDDFVDPATFAQKAETIGNAPVYNVGSTGGAQASNGRTYADYKNLFILNNFLQQEINASGNINFGPCTPERVADVYNTWSYLPNGTKISETNWQQYLSTVDGLDEDKIKEQVLEKLMKHSCQLSQPQLTQLLEALGATNIREKSQGVGARSTAFSFSYVKPAYITFNLNGSKYEIATDTTKGVNPPDSAVVTAEEVEELRQYMPADEFQKVLNWWFTPLNTVDGKVQSYMFSWTGDILSYKSASGYEAPAIVNGNDIVTDSSHGFWHTLWRGGNNSADTNFTSTGFAAMVNYIKTHDISGMLAAKEENNDPTNYFSSRFLVS